MWNNEKEIMDGLHKIREKIYKETKDMTPEERAEFINKRVEKQLAKMGLTFTRLTRRKTDHDKVALK